ncbi:MAG: MBL fold metallo-hydrolase [SAR324 cluster bacterium]|jgi:glyoxylase-like metal-dependent hydrolase (beta-lactamase superfamily II)|nr:MBL fold metallo-hydrolase [SAR324 cluster bacterium]RZO44427.1 MAG: MBL fold metallo-hydrolase [Pseudomonadota bacterium]MDG1486981.1 MBL fold metallo-hydrolase [SAR324 cluster bacterium]MDG2063361.1 MBL fold metallo-hydrolase [SAR324 cluster bacterium]MDP6209669.1 MBL fold metallo-hydrolase [SAR324 cluster bacterium]|tara:strand:- start:3790 stop:4434 length:645 start_codon:yes stop_codon:yes gene_type:complete
MNVPELIVETLPVGHLQCNCTILGDPVSRKAIVVDPGGDAEMLIERLVELDLQVERIIHTHAHLDHFLASGKMKEATGAKLALHRDDLFLWDMLEDQCRMFGIPFEKPPPPDQWLEHEEEIDVKGVQGKALHTPGHTPGSMCFLFANQKLLIAGDTLFQGSIGRTDLWGGDYQQIEKSIQEKLYTLDEETAVITGHGESTNIGHEMRSNSFVRA